MFQTETLAAAGLASGWMLLSAVTAAIPIVIHLLSRRRQVTVRWAAMQLLLEVVQKEAKRVRLEQLLILAVRVSILLTLAVALARPFYTGNDPSSVSPSGPNPRFWIFGIDASYSMGYQNTGVTNFQTAREKAIEVVQSSRQGDAFALLEFASPCRSVIRRATFDQESVLAELRKMTALDTGCDIPSCLLRVQEIVADAKLTGGMPTDIRVIILSDLGRDSWESVLSSTGSRIFAELQQQVSLEVVPVTSAVTSNLAIRSLRPSTYRAIAGQRLSVAVNVENFSSLDARRVPVQFAINDQTVQSKYVDIAAHTSQTISFSMVPKTVGFNLISASIPADRLLADNRRTHVIEVRQHNRVLFVQERPGDARLVRMSLAPPHATRWSSIQSTDGSEIPSTADASRTISSIDLMSVDLSDWDAVVVTDNASLDATSISTLASFARQGGALIYLFGPRTRLDSWRSDALDVQHLGFQFDRVSAAGNWSVDPLEYQSPIIIPFAGFPDSGLLSTPIFRHWIIRRSEASTFVTDLAFVDGSPLIVRNTFGKGTIASILSAPDSGIQTLQDPPWNAMAAWPSFVPLMQQLVLTVTDTDGRDHNLQAGQPIQDEVSGRSAAMITIVRPNGSESQIYTEEMNEMSELPWRYTQTETRGVYAARDSSGVVTPYAVNVNPVESSLESISVSTLPVSAESTTESLVNANRNAASSASEVDDYVSRVLLCLLLALLVSESVLAWYVGRRVG